MDWTKKVVLLTGGTGSFGQKFTQVMMNKYQPKALRIFSRDELKQWNMKNQYQAENLNFFIGDIRDRDRLERAMDGVDIVVHAAALKQVPLCEYNPFEAVKTNVLGAQNIIDAAIDHNVEMVMAISTDKAVNPVNLYGATKMCMEKLVIAGNAYVGAARRTKLCCVRYGNVVGSRGSIVPLFREQKASGAVTITDKRMTRFWITLDQGVDFVIRCIEAAQGGEIFVPKRPSLKITDLARAIVPDCRVSIIGIRPGEKLHECLLTEDESRNAFEFDDFYVIESRQQFWSRPSLPGGKPVADGYRYTSDTNSRWLTPEEIREMAGNA